MKEKRINKMYKVELTSDEWVFLRVNLTNSAYSNEEERVIANELYKKLGKAEIHCVSINKKLATMKATQVRTDKAIEKINNAINLLHLENKAITHYSIAKTGGVSFNTVKKHIPNLDIIGKL